MPYKNFEEYSDSVTEDIKDKYKDIITELGEDISRDGILKTPERAAKAMQFLTQGYSQDAEEILKSAMFKEDYDEMVIVKDIEVYSLCEHHLLPFIGKCHVAYLPAGKIIGLSKIARIVDMFAKRLQVQEHLTKEIAECLLQITGAKGANAHIGWLIV